MKRGATAPWRVTYAWQDGPKGVIACPSRDQADLKAEEIKAAAAVQDRVVIVTVAHR